jgi:hypothetical protein
MLQDQFLESQHITLFCFPDQIPFLQVSHDGSPPLLRPVLLYKFPYYLFLSLEIVT